MAENFARHQGWRKLGQGHWRDRHEDRIMYVAHKEQLPGISRGSFFYAIPLWWNNPEWEFFMSIAVARQFVVKEECGFP